MVAPKPRGSGNDKAPKATPGASRITIDSIITGRRHEPDRILIYGTEKVGKSSFAAAAPKPIFVAADEGTSHLDVPRFPEPKRFGEVLDCIRVLGKNDLPYKTVVIDTVGWIDHLIREEVTSEHFGGDHKKYTDYGAGTKVAINYHRSLISILSTLRRLKGYEIILVAHAEVSGFKNPEGEDYMRYKPQIQGDKCPDQYEQWVDSILFANFETYVRDEERRGVKKAVSTGKRRLYAQRTAAYNAGSRWNLPEEELELSYESYEEARTEGGVYVARDKKEQA